MKAKTLAEICGQRWPKLLNPTCAAAYLSLRLSQFRVNAELAQLIHIVDGREVVDRDDLDLWVEQKKEEAK